MTNLRRTSTAHAYHVYTGKMLMGTLTTFVLLGGLLAGCADSPEGKTTKQPPNTGKKVDNTPGSASKLAFITQPRGGTAGLAWDQQPVVAVQDASGNTVTDSTAEVTLTLVNSDMQSASGKFEGGNPVRAKGGVASFSGLSIQKVGKYTFKASSAGLTDVMSASFDIAHGAAAKLEFTTQPGGAVAGKKLITQPVVAIQDAHGNQVTSGADAGAILTMALGSGTGSLLGATSVTAFSGMSTWTGLSVDSAGAKVLRASKPDLTNTGGTGPLFVDSNSFTSANGEGPFQITSTSFENLGTIPLEYKDFRPGQCTGSNNFPQLSWSNIPSGTRGFVLIVDDPNGGDWVHLNLYNIASNTTQIPRLVAVNKRVDLSPYGTAGINDWEASGWSGPCPPSGNHKYHFKIYALSVASISVLNKITRAAFESAHSAKILGSAEIVGISSP